MSNRFPVYDTLVCGLLWIKKPIDVAPSSENVAALIIREKVIFLTPHILPFGSWYVCMCILRFPVSIYICIFASSIFHDYLCITRKETRKPAEFIRNQRTRSVPIWILNNNGVLHQCETWNIYTMNFPTKQKFFIFTFFYTWNLTRETKKKKKISTYTLKIFAGKIRASKVKIVTRMKFREKRLLCNFYYKIT